MKISFIILMTLDPYISMIKCIFLAYYIFLNIFIIHPHSKAFKNHYIPYRVGAVIISSPTIC